MAAFGGKKAKPFAKKGSGAISLNAARKKVGKKPKSGKVGKMAISRGLNAGKSSRKAKGY